MITFDKRKQYMGYEVVNSYFVTKELKFYGIVKMLVREIDLNGKIEKTMPMTSQAIAFYPYEDDRDLEGCSSPLYRELKEAYPDCTPHHDVDGYHIVPTLIHKKFKHFGTVGVIKRERELSLEAG